MNKITLKKYTKMKNFAYLLMVVVMLTSCESVLQEEPKTQTGTDFFYQNEQDALNALTAAYAQMKAGFGYYSQQFLSNVFASSDQGRSSWKHNDYYNGVLTSSNTTLPDTWNQIYIAIRDANNVIYNVPGIDMDESLRDRIVGEAKFLRALHYFNLVRCFGEVPLRTLPVQPGEENGLPVSPLTDIYDVIISDLKYASENCWGRMDVELGRVTNASAQALLARVYLHIASSTRSASEGSEGCAPYATFGADYTAYYEACKMYCDLALSQPGYQLVSTLDDWVNIFDPTKGNNSEILFDIQSSSATEQGSTVSNLFSPRNAGLSGGGWGGTNSVIAGFVENNVDFTDSRYVNGIIHEFETETLRHELNPKLDGYLRFDVETGAPKGKLNRVYTSKYIDSDATTEATSQQNWHVIRLSDVYLMRAEALAEINQAPQLANADVNTLRTRVGMADFDGTGMTMSDFRDALLRERAAELFMEGNRWFDLTRMGVYEEKIKLAFDPKNRGLQAGIRGPEDYTWPIPITEVSANSNID